MKDGFLIVGALNPKARVCDPDANAKELVSLAHAAAEAGVQMKAGPVIPVSLPLRMRLL